MRRLKQIFCVHWFDEQPVREYGYSEGAIICMEQKSYRVTVQPRACSKCGLTEERRVGEPIYEGWN
jgi:predicted Zn-ribbon and HTH transcriptional regulator